MIQGQTNDQTGENSSPEELAETTRMIDNMEKLMGDTDAYAATICRDEGRSSILSEELSSMSLLGQSMAPEKEYRIKSWVSDTRKEIPAASLPMSSTASNTIDSDDATSTETTTEATVLSTEESKVVSRLAQTTKAMVEAGDFHSAEWYLKELLKPPWESIQGTRWPGHSTQKRGSAQ
jgi:hypothetical protein